MVFGHGLVNLAAVARVRERFRPSIRDGNYTELGWVSSHHSLQIYSTLNYTHQSPFQQVFSSPFVVRTNAEMRRFCAVFLFVGVHKYVPVSLWMDGIFMI
jgi:hypothetical protein